MQNILLWLIIGDMKCYECYDITISITISIVLINNTVSFTSCVAIR